MFKNLTSGAHWSVAHGSANRYAAGKTEGRRFRRRRNSGEGVRPGEGELGGEEGLGRLTVHQGVTAARFRTAGRSWAEVPLSPMAPASGRG